MTEKEPKLKLLRGKKESQESAEVIHLRAGCGSNVRQILEKKDQFFPKLLVEMVTLAAHQYSHKKDFETFCSSIGFDIVPFFKWVQTTTQGEPLYLTKARYLMFQAFIILGEELDIEWDEYRRVLLDMPFARPHGTMLHFARELAAAARNNLGK